MLDSGASRHFTNSINDFIDYEAIIPSPVATANRRIEMTGKGTVIFIVDRRALRISPVYHIPDLNTHLLSLGQFLRSGLHSRGSDRKISLQQGKEEFLTFHP